MFADLFTKSPLLAFPIAALVVFISVFVFRAIAAFRVRATDVETLSRLPLDEEEVPRG